LGYFIRAIIRLTIDHNHLGGAGIDLLENAVQSLRQKTRAVSDDGNNANRRICFCSV
jgi:outer membrane murein-binding lipoprotein Lpp